MGWASDDAPVKEECVVSVSLAKKQLYILKKQLEDLRNKIEQIKHTEKKQAMLDAFFNKFGSIDTHLTCIEQSLDLIQFHLNR